MGKITEKNVEVYEEFVWLTESQIINLRVAGKRESICAQILFSASFLAPVALLSIVLLLPTVSSIVVNPIVGPLCMLLGVPFMAINFYISNKIIRKMNMKTFQKKHPDFDTTIDTEVAKLELENYLQLTKDEKEIEEKKEAHLSNLQNNCEEMSRQEKIAFLKQVREQETNQNNFGNLNEQHERQFTKN